MDGISLFFPYLEINYSRWLTYGFLQKTSVKLNKGSEKPPDCHCTMQIP